MDSLQNHHPIKPTPNQDFAQQGNDQETLERYQALFNAYIAPAPTPSEIPLRD